MEPGGEGSWSFCCFCPPCPIFLSPWTWWGVGLRIIAQHWGSSPGSWGLGILLSVLVLGHFPVKLWAVSQVTRNRNRIGRWPTLKTAISKKVECAQICVSVLSSVKALYITANSRRWWSSEGREAQIHLYQRGAELWGWRSLNEFQPNCLWDAKLNQVQYTTNYYQWAYHENTGATKRLPPNKKRWGQTRRACHTVETHSTSTWEEETWLQSERAVCFDDCNFPPSLTDEPHPFTASHENT